MKANYCGYCGYKYVNKDHKYCVQCGNKRDIISVSDDEIEETKYSTDNKRDELWKRMSDKQKKKYLDDELDHYFRQDYNQKDYNEASSSDINFDMNDKLWEYIYNKHKKSDSDYFPVAYNMLGVFDISSLESSIDELKDLFSKFGKIIDIDLVDDVVLIEFEDKIDLIDAFKVLNGTFLNGNRLYLNIL